VVILEDRTAAVAEGEAAAPGMEDAVAVVAPLAAPPAPAFSPAAAGLTLITAAAADPIAVPPPVRTALAVAEDDALALRAEAERGEEAAAGSPCSVASDCSSVASTDFEGVGLGFFGAAAGGAMVFEDSEASAATVEAEARVAAGGRSVFAVDCVPLWGYTSICGRRPEMEDAVATVPRFFDVPLWMLTANAVVDGLDPVTFRLPSHFFGVYDGHGGAQVSPH
jgi:protein phosphatase 2C